MALEVDGRSVEFASASFLQIYRFEEFFFVYFVTQTSWIMAYLGSTSYQLTGRCFRSGDSIGMSVLSILRFQRFANTPLKSQFNLSDSIQITSHSLNLYVYFGFPTQFPKGGEQKHFYSQAYGVVQTGDNTAQEEGLRWD